MPASQDTLDVRGIISLSKGESRVKEQMRHSSIRVSVDGHGHLVPEESKAAVDRLDEPITEGGKRDVKRAG